MEINQDWFEKIRNRAISSVWYPQRIIPPIVRSSYSQSGEDSIIKQVLGRTPQLYVDIGCGHPIEGSNTYRFYREKSRGICIDANSKFRFACKLIRPRDLFIHGGVNLYNQEVANFYRFVEDVYSTFDSERAKNLMERGLVLASIESVRQVNLRELIGSFLRTRDQRSIDLLSVDVEGLDFLVIKNFPFEITIPSVICVEEWKVQLQITQN